MATDNINRTDQELGWRGISTDIRQHPTPNQLDEIRRANPPARIETAVRPQGDETAALAYAAGCSEKLAARVVALERAMENPILLRTVTDLVEGYGNLVNDIAELRQAIAALQPKKK